MISPAALGIYTVAVTWAEMLWMVAGNASSVLLPRLASEKDESKTVQITSQLARVMLIFVFATTVCFGTVAVLVIPILYTTPFQGAVNAFLALLPGIVAMAYTKVISNYLAAINRPELNAKNATMGLVVNLIGNVILIPKYGIVGAAIATSISYASICVLCYRDYVRLTDSRWSEPIVIRRDDVVQSMAMVKSMLGPVFARFTG